MNDSLFEKKLSNETDLNNNNKTQINIDNVQKTVNLTSILNLNQTNQSQLAIDEQNKPKQIPIDEHEGEEEENKDI